MRISMSTAFHPQRDGQSYSDFGRHVAGLRIRFQRQLGRSHPINRVRVQQQLPFQPRNGTIRSTIWTTLQVTIMLDGSRGYGLNRPGLCTRDNWKCEAYQTTIRDCTESTEELHGQTTARLEFTEGDHVFLKVSPRKGIKRFGATGKLSPRYIGPF